jgi:hypothetical protein
MPQELRQFLAALKIDYPGRELDRVTTGAVVFLPIALMLLFRRKCPSWGLDRKLALTRFATRCWAYPALSRDQYPSTDQEQAVHLESPYPDAARELNPYLPPVKWFLTILHYVVLGFVSIAATAASLSPGWQSSSPVGIRGRFDFVVGVPGGRFGPWPTPSC